MIKRFLFLTCFFLHFYNFCFSQSENSFIEGYWYGLLEFQNSALIITFDIKTNEQDSLIGEVNSPLQGAYHIPVTKIKLLNDSVELQIKSLSANVKGKYIEKDSIIDGIFHQAIFNIPFKLKKTPELFVFKRPQEPKPPFNYLHEEVFFENAKSGITLAGTLTYPKGEGVFPAVILISGSGAQDRNEEILAHKPFLIISDYLTNKGIAVLRYDDRGVGMSKGDFETATTMDFAYDAESAVDFLKNHSKIDKQNIGLIGHSEGGMIAPIVAARDKTISFIILLAAPGTSGEQVLLSQIKKMLEIDGADKELINTILKDSKNAYKLLKKYPQKQKAVDALRKYFEKRAKKTPEQEHVIKGYNKQAVELKIMAMNTPWFRFFISFNPEDYLRNVDCPILALYGRKDVQVLAEENSAVLQKISEKYRKSKLDIKIYDGKNHLFQNADKGSILEYALIEETISEDVLYDMWIWVEKTIRNKE